MSNPLLQASVLPDFSAIKPEYILEAVQSRIQNVKQNLNQALDDNKTSWEELIEPLEQWLDELNQTFSPISHLNSVANNDELREAYNTCLPLISQLHTELGQNQGLYLAYKALKEADEFENRPQAQKAAINQQLRDFKLQGVALEPKARERFAEIQAKLAKLSNQFAENVLDATQAWHKLIDDENELQGLPKSALDLLAQQAKQNNQEGFRLTLDAPAFLPIMMHCENRLLREEVYIAYQTRASEIGPNAGEFDNTGVMQEILTLKAELAGLVGFENYAEYSIASKMAQNTHEVLTFLEDLANNAKPQAQKEFKELQEFAKAHLGLETLEPWDISFASEKFRSQKFAFEQEELKPYFPLNRVLSGLFHTVKVLFNIEVKANKEVKTYHKDVVFYELFRDGKKIAGFYLDLFARPDKRGGAWMDECRVRRKTSSGIQLPVAYLVGNFTPAINNEPALLTHQEVTTLFHEFGHGIHHMLTSIDVAAVSGINGVAWDAVELPSQFLENWCYEPEALAFISGHYQTNEPLPDELLNKLIAAKNFQSAMQMLRQIEFALFDFKLHLEDGNKVNTQAVLDEVRKQVSVVPIATKNRFQHGFSHIFAGGYAAGYYSYKWAEVLSADAFSRFQQEGIFNSQTGSEFLQHILEQGGSQEALDLFEAFRGRKPQVEALLEQSGISK